MTITRLDYLPFVIASFAIFCFFYLKQNIRFYKWVKTHWFYRQSLVSRLSTLFYLISMLLLLISVLDFRGKEQKIKSDIPDQKTIILIDSSSSMLVEDVRPNRFQKALLLARHFVKQAVGQQISIILFSDYQKTYVPFTTDSDLLDARISGLSTLNITKGGSNLSQAIQESIQYFKESSGDSKLFSGNILIFTDSEETVEGIDLQVPDGISVGIVGVGTARGGPIPLRDTRNISYGNKQYNGQEIISKLDEGFLKVLGTKIKNYKYWIATSFALPTEDIIKFFSQVHNKRFSQGDIKVRPVKVEWLLIPALILFSLAMILKMQKSFVIMSLLCFISFSNIQPARAQQSSNENEETVPPLDAKQKALIAKIANGEASREEKLLLAESFLKTKKIDQGITLFQENLPKEPVPQYYKSYMNLGTALLSLGDLSDGLKVYSKLSKKLKENPSSDNQQLLKIVQANTLLAFKKDEEQKKQKKNKNQQDKNQDNKDEEQKEDQKDQMDQKENQDGNRQGKNSQSDKENDKQAKDKKDEKSGKNKKDQKEKKDKENKDKNQKDQNDKGEKNKEDEKEKENGEDDQENEEKEDAPPEKKLKVKLPAQLKQLMNDDRNLQEQILDTSTSESGKSKKAKDW